ncbi:hypothetical protein RDABS01_036099 [Bienertia sinuspersici]
MTAVIALVTVMGAILAAISIFFPRRRIMQIGNIYAEREKRLKKYQKKYNFEVGQLELQEPPLYTDDMLRNATNNFDENNKLGEGGFGILESRKVKAVKRLLTSSGQGLEEFMTKLKVISKLQLRNLVKLLGCCIGDEKMLVYEYMPNKSLDAYLFSKSPRSRTSIMGVMGFSIEDYPSGPKPSNILLDEYLNPIISDFRYGMNIWRQPRSS